MRSIVVMPAISGGRNACWPARAAGSGASRTMLTTAPAAPPSDRRQRTGSAATAAAPPTENCGSSTCDRSCRRRRRSRRTGSARRPGRRGGAPSAPPRSIGKLSAGPADRFPATAAPSPPARAGTAAAAVRSNAGVVPRTTSPGRHRPAWRSTVIRTSRVAGKRRGASWRRQSRRTSAGVRGDAHPRSAACLLLVQLAAQQDHGAQILHRHREAQLGDEAAAPGQRAERRPPQQQRGRRRRVPPPARSRSMRRWRQPHRARLPKVLPGPGMCLTTAVACQASSTRPTIVAIH